MREQYSMGLSETGCWLPDPSEVLRLPGRRSLVPYRSDILRYPVLASKVKYRSWWHWRWWKKYDRWPTLVTDALPRQPDANMISN